MARLLVVALLVVLSFIMYLDRAAISTAKDLIAADLSLSNERMGMVFGSFALGYALAQIPSGLLADRMGPRLALASVVIAWSVFTSLTGMVTGFWALWTVRFLFGIAEAGAFPGSARAFYNWLPSHEHGRANGAIFSGSRLGAALSFPILAWLMGGFGWRPAFLMLGLPGIVWAAIWLAWFRDRPPRPVTRGEPPAGADIPFAAVFRSRAMLLAMLQYFASNFTFFICLSWMLPFLMEHHKLPREQAAWYSMLVLLVGATAQWLAGTLVDRLYRSSHQGLSRRLPAMSGFLLAAGGLVAMNGMSTPAGAVMCFTLATFGAEMTISPSWAYCIDIGGRKSGAVSGSMNMIGNFGSFVSASIFPVLYGWTGGAAAYFGVAAALNVVAALVWFWMLSPQPGCPSVILNPADRS
ncbi:MAG: MFS transporter [Acidobacteria bacterium]|nr:MFS transporter [Acidobacteriota bacterium]